MLDDYLFNTVLNIKTTANVFLKLLYSIITVIILFTLLPSIIYIVAFIPYFRTRFTYCILLVVLLVISNICLFDILMALYNIP